MHRGVLGIAGLGLTFALSLTACGSSTSDTSGGSTTAAAGTSQAADPPPSGASTAGASGGSASAGYTTYRNSRFGFSIALPTSFTPLGAESANGDGRKFSPDGGQVTVSVYGSNNSLNETAASAAASYVAQKKSENARVTLNNVNGNTYTVSGYNASGDTIWYQHMIIESQAEFGLEWTYPASKNAQLNPEVTKSVNSFVPGPNKPA